MTEPKMDKSKMDKPWKKEGRPARIFFLAADFWGCGWYRMHVPGIALATKGYEVAMEDEIVPGVLDYFDVFVFQRQWSPPMPGVIEQVKASGKLIVGELDDDFWHLHPDSPALGFWYGDDKIRLMGMEDCLRRYHKLTTTTKTLAGVLKQFNRDIVILPNQLPSEHWRVKHEPRENGRLIVGWAGGEPHKADMDLLAGTMEQILDEFDNVEFHVAGMKTYPFRPRPEIKALTPVPVEQYPKLLAGFDVGLAPLIDSPFNRSKSDLKYVEYSKVGVPAVYSKVGPYVGAVKHGETGFLADNTKDWLKYVRRLIVDADLRRSIADSARAVAEQRTIEKNIHLWEQAYGLV